MFIAQVCTFLQSQGVFWKSMRSISISDRNSGDWSGLVTILTWLVMVFCSWWIWHKLTNRLTTRTFTSEKFSLIHFDVICLPLCAVLWCAKVRTSYSWLLGTTTFCSVVKIFPWWYDHFFLLSVVACHFVNFVVSWFVLELLTAFSAWLFRNSFAES